MNADNAVSHLSHECSHCHCAIHPAAVAMIARVGFRERDVLRGCGRKERTMHSDHSSSAVRNYNLIIRVQFS